MKLKSVPESSPDFYHLQQPDLNGIACRGLACFAARADMPQRWQRAQSGAAPLYCLGQCYCAPAVAGENSAPLISVQSRNAVLLGDVLAAPLCDLSAYQHAGGGQALRLALASGSANIIEQIAASDLRGRGGAGFPAAKNGLRLLLPKVRRNMLWQMLTKATLVASATRCCWSAIHSA